MAATYAQSLIISVTQLPHVSSFCHPTVTESVRLLKFVKNHRGRLDYEKLLLCLKTSLGDYAFNFLNNYHGITNIILN